MSDRMYIIKLKGFFDGKACALFEDSEFLYQDGITIVFCPIRDQSTLHGILNQIRDLNLELISFEEGEKYE